MNKQINKVIIMFFIMNILLLPISIADDDIFIIKDNILNKNNDYSISINDNIKGYQVDNNQIYIYTLYNVYIINKSVGIIKNKININNTQKIILSDNYLYARNLNNVYKINIIDGNIESKYIIKNNDIFTKINMTSNTNNINTSNNHDELNNLNWSVAGHIIDTNIDMNGYNFNWLPDSISHCSIGITSIHGFGKKCTYNDNTKEINEIFKPIEIQYRDINDNVFYDIQPDGITFYSYANLNNGAYINNAEFDGSSITNLGSLGTTLTGANNAYACLDSSGYLFRSDLPCI